VSDRELKCCSAMTLYWPWIVTPLVSAAQSMTAWMGPPPVENPVMLTLTVGACLRSTPKCDGDLGNLDPFEKKNLEFCGATTGAFEPADRRWDHCAGSLKNVSQLDCTKGQYPSAPKYNTQVTLNFAIMPALQPRNASVDNSYLTKLEIHEHESWPGVHEC
jgi:hypothetical protein